MTKVFAPFRNLTLAFEKRNDDYVVRVANARGEARAQVPVRIPQADGAAEMGAALFEAIFHGEIHIAYELSLASFQDVGMQLGLNLAACPELEKLPWELLYDTDRGEYVAMLPGVLLVRVVLSKRPPTALAPDGPPRVLTVFPNLDNDWRTPQLESFDPRLQLRTVIGAKNAPALIAEFRPDVVILAGTTADDDHVRDASAETVFIAIGVHTERQDDAELFLLDFYGALRRRYSLADALYEARRSFSTSPKTRLAEITITSFEPVDDRERSQPSIAEPEPLAGRYDPSRGQRIDHVEFSVFAPSVVQARTSFVLTVWAALREPRDPRAPDAPRIDQRPEMLERASAGGKLSEAGSRGLIRISASSDLTLDVALDGFEIPEPTEILSWEGEIANASFIVRAPEIAPGSYPGTVRVSRYGLLLARVIFTIVVGTVAVERPTELAAPQRVVRSAFASYASIDREAVLGRVQGIRTAGIEVFVDVLALRAGAHWEEELRRAIDERDVLYLFWSAAARASKWVEREWRLALELKGVDFIWPVPLVDPHDVPPPPELSARHFNDDILAHIERERERSHRAYSIPAPLAVTPAMLRYDAQIAPFIVRSRPASQGFRALSGVAVAALLIVALGPALLRTWLGTGGGGFFSSDPFSFVSSRPALVASTVAGAVVALIAWLVTRRAIWTVAAFLAGCALAFLPLAVLLR